MARIGIATRLGLLLAAFGVLAVVLTGYYTYLNGSQRLRLAAERNLLTSTQVLGRSFGVLLERVARDTDMLARLPDAVDALDADDGSDARAARDTLADTFAAMMGSYPNYARIRLISGANHGLEQVRVDRVGGGTARLTGLALQEKGHAPYVFETLRRGPGQVYLSDIGLNRGDDAPMAAGQPILRVACPVIDGDGTALGVAVITLDLQRYFGQLHQDLPASYRVYLANHRGDFLVHPDPAQTFGFEHGRRMLVQETYPPVAELIEGRRGSVVVTPEHSSGDGEAVAFVRLPFGDVDDGRFLVLGLAQPLDEVLSLSTSQRESTLELVLLFSLLAVGISALVARAVTGPVNTMANAVMAISRGEQAGSLPMHRQDELGVLARSVAHMQQQIASQLAELEHRRSELDHLAHHDALTGLPNRRMFQIYLDAAIVRARRSGRPFALLFVDLDHFKEINDERGHAVGDEVLRAVANRLRAHVRADDTVARLGGDEFTVLEENLEGPEDAALVAAKLHDCFLEPFQIDGKPMTIGASIGVSLYPTHGDEATDLLSNADNAMYHAKLEGRNSFRVYAEGAGE